MSKKKVAKQLGLTAAVAASAVVAANPASAASASTVETAVVQAEKDAIALGKFYRNADLEVSADFSAAYNKAKKSIESAKAQVATLTGSQKSLLSARVAAADANRLKAAYYIDGVKFVQNDLAEATAALAEHVEAGEITDETVEVYNNLSATIRKAERVIGKIYGSEVRDALLSTYLLDAKFAREAVIYEVSQYELMQEIAEQVAAGELATAEENFKVLERLKVRAVEIKEAGRALYPDRTDVYPDLPSIEDQLRTAETAVDASYEAALAPAVKSVSAINGTKLEVKFNKAVDKNTVAVADFTVTPLEGQATLVGLTGSLSEDGKTFTIETAAGQYFNKRYDVKLADKAVKSTDGKDVAEYTTTINVSDKTAPVITSATYTQAGSGKVDITVNFDEQLQSVGTVSVNGSAVVPTFSANTKTMKLTGVDAGKSYQIDVVGAKDVAGNLANPLSTSISTSADTVAPSVSVSVTEATIKLDFSEEVDAATVNKFVVNVNGGAALTPVQSGSDKTVYTVDASSVLAGSTFLNNAKIKVTSIYDLAGNKGQDVEVTANIVKDTTAPKFVSASTESAKLVLKYDEAIKAATATNITEADLGIKLVDKDGVQHTLTATTDFTATTVHGYDLNGNGLVDANTEEEKYVVVTLAEAGGKDFIDASGKLIQGSYTVTVAKDQLEDAAGNKVAANTFSVTSGAGSVTKSVTYTANNTGLANNQFKVVYSEAMSNDALDASKYTLAGVALPAGTTLTFVDSKQNVLVTLPEGYITVDGSRSVVVSGVTANDGDLQDSSTQVAQTVTFKENVVPVAKTVTITNDGQAVVDFSEAVAGATTGITVKVNGTTVTPASLSNTGGDLQVNFAAGTLKLTDKVTVEFSGSVLADTAGNKVKDSTISN
ncbi:hypothetical protein [Metabacillus litoralis]|uniref:hypothetical protein n=1 Tax=Metabacillus litoralis TaxID=152268 RepID=UPI00203B3799|nr:hypothetical protein [Metabacillus litoralis]MCM3410008.1 hypothetical protein [Metabacillus litoralis]